MSSYGSNVKARKSIIVDQFMFAKLSNHLSKFLCAVSFKKQEQLFNIVLTVFGIFFLNIESVLNIKQTPRKRNPRFKRREASLEEFFNCNNLLITVGRPQKVGVTRKLSQIISTCDNRELHSPLEPASQQKRFQKLSKK